MVKISSRRLTLREYRGRCGHCSSPAKHANLSQLHNGWVYLCCQCLILDWAKLPLPDGRITGINPGGGYPLCGQCVSIIRSKVRIS